MYVTNSFYILEPDIIPKRENSSLLSISVFIIS